MKVRTGLSIGLTTGLLVLGSAPAAWADDPAPDAGSGSSSSSDPGTTDPAPPADPADPPAEDPAEPTDPPAEDPAEPTDPDVEDTPTDDEATDGTTDEGTAEEPPAEDPDSACGVLDPDGVDPCVLYATGGGLPEGAVEKDATSGSGTLGTEAAQLPRTGDETLLLALAGLGLVVLGSASVAAGRPRRTA